MALSCGIVGLPLTGKTTIYNILTRAGAETSRFFSGKTAANSALAFVPDKRLGVLSDMFKPRKTTYAQIELIDIPGLARGAHAGKGADFLTQVRDTDALVQVVRTFSNADIPHSEDSLNPMRDIDIIASELLFYDLALIESRLDRMGSGSKKKSEHPKEEAVLIKCRTHLEEEKPLKLLSLDEEEQEAIKHITFLTQKPMLLVVNTDEDNGGEYPQKERVSAYAASNGMELLPFSARIEAEIAALSESEQELFLADMGLAESGADRLNRAIYAQLGLISFLTAGEDEVRAWTVSRHTTAKNAAGKIHSDIERGFIRAETVAFNDLMEAGSMAKAREKGLFRLEGKEYIIKDGDIINFRFNV